MSLFSYGLGTKNIDRSLTVKENIQNTILNNITKTTNNFQVTGSIQQKISVNCEPIFTKQQETLKAYIDKGNTNPEIVKILTDTSIYDKMCRGKNLNQIANIDLKAVNQNKDQIAKDIETNIKRDLLQMKDVTKDKNWASISIMGKNINESQNIQKIVDNLEKTNIIDIVKNTLTNAKINQEIMIGLGEIDGAEQIGTINLMVQNITDSILKDVDKTYYDTKVAIIDKEVEKDQISSNIGGIFGNLFSTVKTGIGMGGIIVLGFIALVGLIAVFAPQVFCFIPGINVAMGATCSKADLNKNAMQDYRNRPQYPQGYPQGYPQCYLQGYPQGYLQGYQPQGYQPQSYPPQGYPQSGIIVPVNPQQPMNLQQEFSE